MVRSSMPMTPPDPTPPSPEETVRAEAFAWLSHVNSGEFDEESRREFEAWLARDEKHRREYERAAEFWRGLDGFAPRLMPQPAPSFPRSLRWAAGIRGLPVRGLLVRALAACALLFAVLVLGRGWAATETYRTVKGEHRSVTLADGSKIDLDTATELVVTLGLFERSVRMGRGEAVFTVAHESWRPFVVSAGTGWIRDVGTAFDVRIETGSVTVAVLDGEVSVGAGADADTEKRLLTANQAIGYDDAGTLSSIGQLDTRSLTAWRQGRLVFDSIPLREVLRQVMRYHNVDLVVEDPALASVLVSGAFATNDLKAFLLTLEATLPVRMEYGDDRHIRLVPYHNR